jgi:tetratricopeptide (TPR) repeat protein
MIRTTLTLALVLTLTFGCTSQEDRAATHAEQASAHLDMDRPTDALIEFHNALKLAPRNASYAEAIAQILIAQGKNADARFYLGEAYRIDPTNETAAVAMAFLQFGDEPEAADQILAEIIAENPNSAWGYIGRSEQALIRADIDEARAMADRSIEVDPELADAHWQRARVDLAAIRERALTRRPPDEALLISTLASLERFGALDSSRSWLETIGRARLLAAWPGLEVEAEATLRDASAELRASALPIRENEILDIAIEFAGRVNRPQLERWALERKVAITPRNYGAWDALAAVHQRLGDRGGPVYYNLIKQFPDDAEPYIRRARHIDRTRGSQAAIRSLRREIPDQVAGPKILAEIIRLILDSGDQAKAFRVVEDLARVYPESREAITMAAWRLAAEGRPHEAIGLLQDHPWTQDDVGALRIQTDAYMRLRDSASALSTLERTLEIIDEPEVTSRRLRAALLHDLGRYPEARKAFAELSRHTKLRPDDLSKLADTYIATGGRAVGIGLLESLVELPNPPRTAVIRLSQVGVGTPKRNELIREGFHRLLPKSRANRDLIEHLVVFEISAGTPERARTTLRLALQHGKRRKLPPGRLELLLAMVEHAEGKHDAARELVLGILEREPRLPGALEFAGSLYPTREEALLAIEEIKGGRENQDIDAARHALLGRLYYRADNPVMARWSYEQALTGGLELPILKNDLAFLLAAQQRDLVRARLLAQQAAQALPNEPGVLDTLGFVLLQLQEFDQALLELQRADAVAQTRGLSRATVQYHLGLALNGLNRSTEAEQAFARALEFGEDFPDEEAARRELALLRGQG